MRDDILTLTDQVTDIGVGTIPHDEIPSRPESSTPSDQENDLKPHREALMKKLEALLKTNEEITGFCSHPDSVIPLTVLPDNHHKVFHRQYRVAEALVQPTPRSN